MGKQKIKCISKNVCEIADSKEIEAIAKKREIQFPSEHLGFFKTIYAEIEKPNLNNVRLARHAVEKALPTLIGSQVNFSHLQAGFIMGSVLDAWINDNDEIEIVYSFFKEVYKDEYEQSVELAKQGELSVSFELLSERDSQEWLPDGTVMLNDITFTGCGHLMSEAPACPKAKIYEFASRCKERLANVKERELVFASQIEAKCDEILSQENSDPLKVHADRWTSDIYNAFPDSSFAVIEPAFLDGDTSTKKARHLPFKDRNGRFDLTNYRIALDKVDYIHPVTESITTEELRKEAKEELDKYTDMRGNAKVELTEEQKAKIEELRVELGKFAEDVKDEDLLDEVIVAEIRRVIEAEVEEAPEETAKEEKTEEKAEETEEPEADEPKAEKTEEAKLEEEIAFKVDSVEIRTFSLEEKDGVESVVESIQIWTTTDWNSMLEAKTKVEELEKSLEAKDSEIESIRTNAELVGKTKVQLSENEFAKDFTDEDFLDEEKVTKVIQEKKDSEALAVRKEELKDNEYAKDFTDEDYLNDDKVELAKVKKEKDELVANAPKEEINASVEEEPKVDMETGETEEVDEGKAYKDVMASIRKDRDENREIETIFEKK